MANIERNRKAAAAQQNRWEKRDKKNILKTMLVSVSCILCVRLPRQFNRMELGFAQMRVS